MKKRKISAIILSALVASTTILSSVQAKTMIEGPIAYSSGPVVPGTEDIIAQDTVWKYGVQQTTTFGAAVATVSLVLGAMGPAKIASDATLNYLANQFGGYLVGTVLSNATSRTVNIRFDRYIVRGSDGKTRYKVFATYYNLDGSIISSNLVQSS